MAKSSRRTLNNILIFSVLCFITLFNLPNVIRKHLLQEKNEEIEVKVIALLPKSFEAKTLQFSELVLSHEDNLWQSNKPIAMPAQNLANRWLTLTGTQVNEALLEKLKPNLTEPFLLRVQSQESTEPYQLIYYQTPEFWLMQNWQGQWLAVSVDKDYLMPLN